MIRRLCFTLMVCCFPLTASGCIVVLAGGHGSGARAWTEESKERIELNAEDISSIEVVTHNGRIAFTGQSSGELAHVSVTKKGGGRTSDDAQAALDAIDVFVEEEADGVHRMGWRWHGIKKQSWRAVVSFDVVGPGRIDFTG